MEQFFFIGGGASFGTMSGNEGMDFLVTIEKGTLGNEGGGGRPEGSVLKTVSGGGGASVFFGVGGSFLGDGAFPLATCLTLAIFSSSVKIKKL